MANRDMTKDVFSMEKMRKMVSARVTFGASGAPTLDGPNSKGVLSVTRQSAGLFTFVFGVSVNGINYIDGYNKVLGVAAAFDTTKSATTSPAAVDVGVYQNEVANVGGLISAPPVQATPVAASGGGFTAGAYRWVVTALDANGQETLASNEQTLSPTTNQQVTISWAAVPGATSYNVYRTAASGAAGSENVIVGNTGALSLVDAGTAPTAGAATYGYGRPPLALASLTLAMFNNSGTLTDPAQGEILQLQLDLGDSGAA